MNDEGICPGIWMDGIAVESSDGLHHCNNGRGHNGNCQCTCGNDKGDNVEARR